MQIKCLHKNIYRFYSWARTQECLDAYRKEIEESVRHWESLRVEGVSTINAPRLRAFPGPHITVAGHLRRGRFRPQRLLKSATNPAGERLKSSLF